MIITLDMLEQRQACDKGLRLFDANFDASGGTIEELIDVCVENRQDDDAYWLLEQFNDASRVTEIDGYEGRSLFVNGAVIVNGDLKMKRNVVATGGIIVHGDLYAVRDIIAPFVYVDGSIYAGLNLKVKGDITAGKDVKAGLLITADGEIKHGDGYGVYAGLKCPHSNKGHGDVIKAASRPENIIEGTWYEDEVGYGEQ